MHPGHSGVCPYSSMSHLSISKFRALNSRSSALGCSPAIAGMSTLLGAALSTGFGPSFPWEVHGVRRSFCSPSVFFWSTVKWMAFHKSFWCHDQQVGVSARCPYLPCNSGSSGELHVLPKAPTCRFEQNLFATVGLLHSQPNALWYALFPSSPILNLAIGMRRGRAIQANILWLGSTFLFSFVFIADKIAWIDLLMRDFSILVQHSVLVLADFGSGALVQVVVAVLPLYHSSAFPQVSMDMHLGLRHRMQCGTLFPSRLPCHFRTSTEWPSQLLGCRSLPRPFLPRANRARWRSGQLRLPLSTLLPLPDPGSSFHQSLPLSSGSLSGSSGFHVPHVSSSSSSSSCWRARRRLLCDPFPLPFSAYFSLTLFRSLIAFLVHHLSGLLWEVFLLSVHRGTDDGFISSSPPSRYIGLFLPGQWTQVYSARRFSLSTFLVHYHRGNVCVPFSLQVLAVLWPLFSSFTKVLCPGLFVFQPTCCPIGNSLPTVCSRSTPHLLGLPGLGVCNTFCTCHSVPCIVVFLDQPFSSSFRRCPCTSPSSQLFSLFVQPF